ncbi:MAG TPA: hypothetical protein VEJ41_05020 [Candidatus Acidoferrales bacterium]|nr:hypothetical protein [Candidatus Acidoferrales bacterium]
MAKALFLLALSLLLIGASAGPSLDSYRTALAARKIPTFMEFSYTVTRSGPDRIVTEQHRVYWSSAGEERNDTIAVNGTPVVPAPSQTIHRAPWPYDPQQFAVSADDYDATPAGIAIVSGRRAYAFALARGSPADFMQKSIYVDVKTHLPLRQTFAVAGEDCEGAGSIDFGPFSGYWLPSFVSVTCTQAASGASPPPIFKESIRFTGYQFPSVIPPDVFGQSGAPQDAAGSGQ